MARMSTILIIGAVTVAVGAGVVYYSYKKGLFKKKKIVKPICNLNVKNVQGTLPFTDVIGWFKSLRLDSQKATPFVALADQLENMIGAYFKSDIVFVYPPLPDDVFKDQGKKRILLGVYDENIDEVSHALLIVADAFDQKTLDVLGNESLIVLS